MPSTTLCLKVQSGPSNSASWEITHRAQIGRLPHLGVCINDDSLSRVHAELTPRDTGWVVCDLGSMNGTYLNGEQLGRAEASLRQGDQLQVGKVLLVVAAITTSPAVPSSVCPPRTLLDRSARLSWDTLPPFLSTIPGMDRAASQHVAKLVRIGRTYDPSDPLKSHLTSVLWQTAEVLEAPRSGLHFFTAPATVAHPQLSMFINQADAQDLWHQCDLPARAVAEKCSLLVHLPADTGGGAVQSIICALLRVEERILGTLCLARSVEQPPFGERDLIVADAFALAASASLLTLVEFCEQQKRLLLKTLTALTQLVHLRDDRTGNHGQRTTDYALMLAEQLDLGEEEKELLRIGTPLHDLGKIGIRDAVLQKPGKLTDEETVHLRQQILRGAELLEKLPSLSALLPIARNSHEHWDGAGYPDGLKGPQIPILGRVVAVADAFDSMTTEQPYRKALSVAQALRELQARSGSQFDPNCVRAFVALQERLETLVVQRRAHTHTISMRELRQLLRQRDNAQPGSTPSLPKPAR